jgi:DNA polymerase bacteriophage-type
MPILHRDYETRSTLDLRDVGAWRYSYDSTTDVWCGAYAIDDEPVKLWVPGDPVPPEFIEAASDPAWTVSAFNDAFERVIEQHIMAPRYGWPPIPIERHRCSQAAALALALPAALEDVARVLELKHQKDKAGATLMRRMSKPRKPRKDEDPNGIYWHDWDPRLGEYCKQDTETERELVGRVPPLISAEQALWQLDAQINDRGLHLDRELINAAIRVAQQAQHEIAVEFAGITGGIVTSANQTARLIAWLATHGCPVTDVQKGTLKNALRRKDVSPEARRVIELRLDAAHASANKLETMHAWTNGDARVRGALKFHGASTGRWASYGIQLQNLKRPAIEDLESAIAAVATGDLEQVRRVSAQPMSVIGDITRALIIAAPGHRLIAGDFSGIESRVTAWISGQQSKLDQWSKFDTTQDPADDPYFVLGQKLGQPPERARAIGKTADLAFGYMGSVGAWKRLAPDDTSSEEQIIKYRNAWRRAHPQTVRLWRVLDRAATMAMREPGKTIPVPPGRVSFIREGDFLFMVLPSGRRLAYPFPRVITNERGDPVVIYKDIEKGQWADCRHGQGAYGGTWIENAVQAIARDLFAAAMPRLEAVGYAIVLHVHDEIVCEVPNGFGSEDAFKAIMLALPSWAEGLPVNAKTRNGPRFCKTATPQSAHQTNWGEALERDFPRAKSNSGNAEIPWEEEKHTSEAPKGPRYEYNRPNDDATRNYASGESDNGHHVGSYVYQDAGGNPYLKVIRTSAKQFPQFHWENGRWISKPPAGPKIPYRVPELIAAKPDTPIFICEGEKDTDNIAALGLLATTNSGGAGKWTDDLNKWFVGKQVAYVLEDNDAAGRAHTAKIASALSGIVPDIRIVSFPELPERGDVSDWLEQGHTKEELLERARNAPQDRLNLVGADELEMCGIEWLWPDRFALGKIGLIAGLPDMGKGQIAAFLVAAVTRTLALPNDEGKAPQGEVIWFNAEDDNRDTIIPRLVAAGADIKHVKFVSGARVGGKEKAFNLATDLVLLRNAIQKLGNVVLVIIDPVSAYLGVGKVDGRSATDVRGVLTPLKDLVEETRVALIGIAHFNKKDDVKSALLRVSDSIAYVAAARSVYAVLEDPEDKDNKLFIKVKMNLAATTVQGLRYRFGNKDVGYDKRLGKVINAPFVEWLEPVEMTANEALAAADGRSGEALREAKEFLLDRLKHEPAPADDVFEEAKQCGITRRTLERAKKELGIRSRKATGQIAGKWMWELPKGAQRE